MHPSSPHSSTTGASSGRLPETGRHGGGSASAVGAVPVEKKNIGEAAAGPATGAPAPARRPRTSSRPSGAARGAQGSGSGSVTNGKNKKEKPEPPQSLNDVLDALVRRQTAALILEHLVEYVADQFRGNDSRGPRKLIAMPNGTRCRAGVDDVLGVERVLRQLAADERTKLVELRSAQVLVERSAVVPAKVARGPVQPPPEGEGVVDAAVARPPAAGGPTRK